MYIFIESWNQGPHIFGRNLEISVTVWGDTPLKKKLRITVNHERSGLEMMFTVFWSQVFWYTRSKKYILSFCLFLITVKLFFSNYFLFFSQSQKIVLIWNFIVLLKCCTWKNWKKYFSGLEKKLFYMEMVFCYHNCSNVLWKKIVLVWGKKNEKKVCKFEAVRPRICNVFEIFVPSL